MRRYNHVLLLVASYHMAADPAWLETALALIALGFRSGVVKQSAS